MSMSIVVHAMYTAILSSWSMNWFTVERVAKVYHVYADLQIHLGVLRYPWMTAAYLGTVLCR